MLNLDFKGAIGALSEYPHKTMQKSVGNNFWCDPDKVA